MAYISLIISASEKSLFVLDVLFLNNSHCQENNTEKLGMQRNKKTSQLSKRECEFRQYVVFSRLYSCPNLSSIKFIVVFDLLCENKSEKKVKQ